MKKNTFLKNDIVNNTDRKHLRIVISDPDVDGNVLIVSLSSIKPHRYHDPSCVLEQENHSFIKHLSYINYKFAEEMICAEIVNDRFKGRVILKENVSDEVLERIQNGAKISLDLPEYFSKFFEHF
jgi:hypothetical protein